MMKCEIKAKHFENITRNHSLQRPCPKNKKKYIRSRVQVFSMRRRSKRRWRLPRQKLLETKTTMNVTCVKVCRRPWKGSNQWVPSVRSGGKNSNRLGKRVFLSIKKPVPFE